MLTNARHEKFAQLIAAGSTGVSAYREAGYSGKGGDVSAHRLLVNAKIAARIAEIREEAAQECRLSKKQLLDFLADVITTPAGTVHKLHPLCQSFKDTKDINEIKLPDKLGAITQLAKMCGWNEPDKIELTGKQEIIIEIGGHTNPN